MLQSRLTQIPADGFPVNEKVDIAVDLTSPAMPGRYFSYWRLASPFGHKFGQRVWVLIQVDISRPSSATGGFGADLNLNLPPESTSRDGFGIIDVNAEPFDDVAPESILASISDELVKPLVNDAPTEGVHPAAADGIAQPTPIVNPPVSYPIIDLSVSEYESSFLVPPSKTVAEDNTVEETLLEELESMGFKQIDLNKEILRLNRYDLEESINDLCGYAEWEPLLEELHDMVGFLTFSGFSDRITNKKLLTKYGGSIKRVVLDLIAGERAYPKSGRAGLLRAALRGQLDAQQQMEVTASSGRRRAVAAGSGGGRKRKSVDVGSGGSILSLGTDLLCRVFALLDHFDLVRCSVICKSWFVPLSC
ncbi:hypothetical protein B296_00027899 [Ensete ventricosum]|uniref:F-box domain-containing protein n=1 Tax=Ensete ventricosum TaxID=4639 RepID=A0A427A3H7_ENSVE|nr:hypothetical protein B296_00027899 [Ensete ventricosum]